ncbi:hypothetical protein [Streptomyces sp. NPDC002853]
MNTPQARMLLVLVLILDALLCSLVAVAAAFVTRQDGATPGEALLRGASVFAGGVTLSLAFLTFAVAGL